MKRMLLLATKQNAYALRPPAGPQTLLRQLYKLTRNVIVPYFFHHLNKNNSIQLVGFSSSSSHNGLEFPNNDDKQCAAKKV